MNAILLLRVPHRRKLPVHHTQAACRPTSLIAPRDTRPGQWNRTRTFPTIMGMGPLASAAAFVLFGRQILHGWLLSFAV